VRRLERRWPLIMPMDAAFQTAQPNSRTDDRSNLRTGELDLAEIYADYFKGVWRNLRRLGVPNALLDDAVQDVFLVVYRRRHEFAHLSSLKTWIFGIVLHVAKDYRRAAKRHAARTTRYAEAVVEDPDDHCPAQAAQRREASAFLHSILERIKYEHRAVFVLVELEELSVPEAAVACSASVATCQRRLRRARTAFNAAVARLNARPKRRHSP
jgi:RNA polymerase sigma-70 factor, ECF subfamily